MVPDDGDRPLQYSSPDLIARFERVATASIPGREHAMRIAAALLANRVPAHGSVLSIGAGSGLELSLLGALRSDWRLTGVDPAAAMIEAARTTLAQQGLAERVDLVQGTLDAVPTDPPFDGATCFMVLPLLSNDGPKLNLLKAAAEHLKPGAALTLTTPLERTDPEMERAWHWFQRSMGQSEAEIAALDAQVNREIHHIKPELLRTLLAEAGFGTPRQYYQAFWFAGWLVERQ